MSQPHKIEANPQATALIANITQLMDEAEQMLCDSTSHHAEGQVELLRPGRDELQNRVVGTFTTAGKKIAAGAQRADRTIRAHPYQSLAVALGIGTVFGLLLARRGP